METINQSDRRRDGITNKLALVCYSLSFIHPTTKENMNFNLKNIENYIKL